MSAGKVIGRIVGVVILVAVLATAAFAYFNRQDIADYFAAQSFEPTQEITELAQRLDLTTAGHRVFFATSPTLEASQRFNEQCADVDHSEDGHVLGCYAQGAIHLFNVTDDRLNGITEVTAAHELLHATFSRLSDDEKRELTSSLTQIYQELSGEDPALAERMSVYSNLSPQSFANELHSVLGTEVRELPDWLEQHYAKWLNDRASIIDRFESYRDVFDQIQDRADELQAEMEDIRADVEARNAAYADAVAGYNAAVEDFNRRNANYEFSDDEGRFWAEQRALQDRAAALNAEHDAIDAEVARYEKMRQELEALNATSNELNEQLDSNLAPPVAPAMA